jgi:hypothetical protein
MPDANTSALDTQVGGTHYKDMKIQPVEFIHANGIGYFEGNVIKYVARWRTKGGIADLEKARHYLDLLIDLESPPVKPDPAMNATGNPAMDAYRAQYGVPMKGPFG